MSTPSNYIYTRYLYLVTWWCSYSNSLQLPWQNSSSHSSHVWEWKVFNDIVTVASSGLKPWLWHFSSPCLRELCSPGPRCYDPSSLCPQTSSSLSGTGPASGACGMDTVKALHEISRLDMLLLCVELRVWLGLGPGVGQHPPVDADSRDVRHPELEHAEEVAIIFVSVLFKYLRDSFQ